MSAPIRTPVAPFRLAGWLVQPELNRVSGPAAVVQLEPRIMQVLVVLARRPGAVVTREALLDEVWSDTIVGEETLTRAISELRRILGDDTHMPRIIETIRKGGYRLIGEVAAVEEEPARVGVVARSAAFVERRGDLTRLGAVALLAVLAATVVALVRRPVAAPPTLQPVPFTTYAGREMMPALSPDGTAVAFAWTGPAGDNADVYLKQRGTETALRLTEHPGREGLPAWSPDGATVFFVREDAGRFLVLAVPAIGGPARVLTTSAGPVRGLDVHPDGGSLVLAAAPSPGAPSRLLRLDLATLESHPLTSPPEQFGGDESPAWAPRGEALAFVRGDRAHLEDIWLLEDGAREPRRLTHGQLRIQGLDWSGPSELVFSAFTGGTYGLWRLDVARGSLAWVPVVGERIYAPTVSTRARRLVYERLSWEKNVWQITRSGARGPGEGTAPLIASTHWDCEACFSPDGSRLAFTSSRSGSLELWTCAADGSAPVQLSSFGGPFVSGPRFSPDGRRLAFTATPDGWSAVFVLDVAGGVPQRLSDGEHNDVAAAFSRDGRHIYLASDRSGSWQIWRVRPDGSGAEQVTREGGVAACEGTDGALLVARPGAAGIWRLGADGAMTLVFDGVASGDSGNWVLHDGGITFIDRRGPRPVIAFADLASGRVEPVAEIPNIASPSLAVSPDGRTILYSRIERTESDLMLVERFR